VTAQNLPKAGILLVYVARRTFSERWSTPTTVSPVLVCHLSAVGQHRKAKMGAEPAKKCGTSSSSHPVYPNLAAIGLKDSIVSSLILVFNIFTFSLFLVVQQCNILTISRSDTDTERLIYSCMMYPRSFRMYVVHGDRSLPWLPVPFVD